MEDPTQNNDLAAKMPDKLKQLQDIFYLEAKKYNVLPLDNSTLARWNAPQAEPDGGTNGIHLLGRVGQRAGQHCAEYPEQVLHHHGRGRDPRGWRGRHDRHRGRTLRRLWPVPEQGRIRHSAGARWCSSTTCSTSSARRGKGPSWKPASTPSSSTSSPTVQVWARAARACSPWTERKWPGIPWSTRTPITFPEDETFDIGQDTRTGVALVEYRYDVSVQVHRQDRQVDFQTRASEVIDNTALWRT